MTKICDLCKQEVNEVVTILLGKPLKPVDLCKDCLIRIEIVIKKVSQNE